MLNGLWKSHLLTSFHCTDTKKNSTACRTCSSCRYVTLFQRYLASLNPFSPTTFFRPPFRSSIHLQCPDTLCPPTQLQRPIHRAYSKPSSSPSGLVCPIPNAQLFPTNLQHDTTSISPFHDPANSSYMQRNLNNAFAYDLVPSPSVITAALRAARRVNDFPTAVRIFEG